jgi:hypothetical protein
MIGKQDSIIEQIYNRIKHMIDDVYRSKGMSSENIRKYFLHKKNFNRLTLGMKDLKALYGEGKFEKTFEDKVSDILFDRILMDRIYYEKDNPQNENRLIINYDSFISS